MPFFGSAHCQYDEHDDGEAHINWIISPSVVPDFWISDRVPAEHGLHQYCTAFGVPLPPPGSIENFTQARRYRADLRAAELERQPGRRFAGTSVSQLIVMTKAFMFPNFHPLWGESLPRWYRFVPLGNDPAASVMEVRITAPIPVSGARPASASCSKSISTRLAPM